LDLDGFVPTTAPSAGPVDGDHASTPAAAGFVLPLGLTLDEAERRYIQATLDDVGQNVGEAAEVLGVTRKVLWSRRKKHGLSEQAAQ
jgi:DNA-binding NtrC family response regulator